MKPLFLAVLLLLAPMAALAQPPITAPIQTPETTVDEEEEGSTRFLKVGLVAFGGVNTYGMNDLNIFLNTSFNTRISSFVPGGSAPQIEDGISAGGGLRLFLKNRFLVEVVYESVSASGTFGGQAYTWDADANATAVLYTVGVDLLDNRSVRFGFAAGVGQYRIDSTSSEHADNDTVVLFSDVDPLIKIESTETVIGEGTTTGQHYLSFVEVRLTPKLSLMTSAGYRRVTLDEGSGTRTEVPVDPRNAPPGFGSTPVQLSDIAPIEWTGFAGRVGLVYYVR